MLVQPSALTSQVDRKQLELTHNNQIYKALIKSHQCIQGDIPVELAFSLLAFEFYMTTKKSLSDFLQYNLGLSSIEPVDQETRWSNNRSFWIVDETTKEKRFFLKTFLRDDKAYLEEIFGLDFLSKVEGISSPKIKLLGKCEVDGKETFLLVEDFIKGESIQQMYWKVSKHPIESNERLKEFETLCKAVEACGAALAKLHAHLGRTKVRDLFPEDEKLVKKLNAAVELLEKSPQEGIEIEKLKYAVDRASAKMKQEQHLTGVTHGDMKLIHTLYNRETGAVAFIDPQTLSQSLDRRHMPVALPSLEFCRYVRSIQLNRIGYQLDGDKNVQKCELLIPEEVEVLIQCLNKGYILGGGNLPTEVEKDFALLLHNLTFIVNAGKELPEPDLTRLRDLVSISQKDLRERFERESEEFMKRRENN